jgi:HAD superfamily hydrolase (TIGR01509 family)
MYIERVKAEGIPVKKGLIELLEFLKERDIKIALATSTSHETARFNLEISNTLKYFDTLVCGNDVKNGKPHPEVFLTAAERLGAKPENCLAYEDSINGIKSAYAAGMVTVMVPDYIPPTEEIKPMITFLCGDLAQSIEKIKPLIK